MANITMSPADAVAVQGAPAVRVRSYWQNVGYRLRYDYLTLFFGAMVMLILLSAVFAPLLAPMDPYESSLINRLKPIGYKDFILGTDELGRDILSRMLYGGRISLTMGIMPVLVATLVGGTLGIVAGFVGGRTNMLIMRVVDVFYAFPSILLAVAISGAMGGGVVNGMLSLTLVFIPPLCRVAETATSQVRNLDFVEAARATGAKTFSIIRVHILGNVLGPILVYSSSMVSVSILLASGLSFLGLGVTPPEPDWGLMLNTLRQAIYINPVVCAIPGVAILITSICFNLVSDGLRSAMDVRL
ncbi:MULTISPECIES: ABC transporter permease [Thalassobaculum]|uniref:Peptide/nickel transport system permease protein n=1 Tax=Thalassobaculum litoreum DSM 18839 TaxID=1123362 RepID=A0A8G2F2Q5_9PROT|nr:MULTISPECIES: ABC transporter permease [Thalassobaculum]SDF63178.1 peptide/nickel transport system permease protein [Thalassobaculum litoreum DSM 18839]